MRTMQKAWKEMFASEEVPGYGRDQNCDSDLAIAGISWIAENLANPVQNFPDKGSVP